MEAKETGTFHMITYLTPSSIGFSYHTISVFQKGAVFNVVGVLDSLLEKHKAPIIPLMIKDISEQEFEDYRTFDKKLTTILNQQALVER